MTLGVRHGTLIGLAFGICEQWNAAAIMYKEVGTVE